MRARLFLTSLLTVIVALATTRAFGIFDRPRDVPVDRLVKNLESYIAEHPDDAQGYYNLARVHSLAFTLKARSIGAFKGRALPMPAPEDMQRFRKLPAKNDGKKGDTSNEEELSPSELQRHAREAVQNYNKAIELDRKQGLFFLSLGSFLEFASAQSSRCWSAPLNIPTDIDEKAKDAGTLIVQDILSGKGVSQQVEKDRVQEIRTGLAALLNIRGLAAITPIIFSMSRTQSMRELVSSRNTSMFDLDGTGRPQKWTWVRPETAILVWDPFRSMATVRA